MESVKHDKYDCIRLKNQICFPLYACAKEVVRQYRKPLERLGLTYTQYLVLLVLWEHDGIPVGGIGEKLMLDNGTLSPLLKKLQQAGYIERQRSSEDERVVVITLTEKGRELQLQAKDIPMKVGENICLPQEDAYELYRLLHKLLDTMEE